MVLPMPPTLTHNGITQCLLPLLSVAIAAGSICFQSVSLPVWTICQTDRWIVWSVLNQGHV